MTLVVDVIEAPSSSPVSLTGQVAAKAYANIEGIGTVTIDKSFNVSSVIDNGTGDFTISFTNSFSDALYTFGGNGGETSGSGNRFLGIGNTSTNQLVGSFRFSMFTAGGSNTDARGYTIFTGDLA
jgi:hypothetical protein